MTRPASLPRMPPRGELPLIAPEGCSFDPPASASLRYLEHGSMSRQVRWHQPACYELHLIVATHGLAYIGDSVSRFAPWSLALLGPHLPHRWVSDPQLPGVVLRERVLQFSEAFLRHCESVQTHPRTLQTLREQAARGVGFPARLGRALNPRLARLGASPARRRLPIVLDLLTALCNEPERRIFSRRLPPTPAPDIAGRQIGQIMSYIHTHYAEDLALGPLAAGLKISDSAFCRRFQRYSGCTFSDYLNQTRIHQACQRLAGGEDPVARIGAEAGYGSLSSFNRRFKAVTGVTPREYRRRHRPPGCAAA